MPVALTVVSQICDSWKSGLSEVNRSALDRKPSARKKVSEKTILKRPPANAHTNSCSLKMVAKILLPSCLLIIAAALHNASSLPVNTGSESSALYYLIKYNYVAKDENSDTAALLSSAGLKRAVKDFQVRDGDSLNTHEYRLPSLKNGC